MEKRNKQLNVRLTDDEYERITEKAQAAGLKRADYVRVSALVLAPMQLGSKLT